MVPSVFRRCWLSWCLLGSMAQPAAAQLPAKAAATYTNPVWDADFPDSTVIHARDGYYYVYGTETRRQSKVLHIQVARSADLVHWTLLGEALPVKPRWARTTDSFWAPHVSEVGSTYYLYFSAKPDSAAASPGAGVGLSLATATAPSPEGPFTPLPEPLQGGPGFVNIDLMQFDDPATGQRLLYWGSGFGPLKVRTLAADRLHFAPGSQAISLVFPDSSSSSGNYQRLVEGSWVVRRQGWYYLLYSGDNCCGANAHYAVQVARSRSATGPFKTLPQATGQSSSASRVRNGQWLAPGHNAVVTDAAGHDWLAYHAISTRRKTFNGVRQASSRRVLLLDRLEYTNGWPRVVPNHGTPSAGSVPALLTR